MTNEQHELCEFMENSADIHARVQAILNTIDRVNRKTESVIRERDAEIARLRAQLEGAVVVPELTEEEINARFWAYPAPSDDEHWLKWAHRDYRWAYHLAASRAHSVPASRVLRDGEVAVDARELAALRNLFSAAGNTIANIRNGATIAEINDAWAGVCSAQIMRSQEGGA